MLTFIDEKSIEKDEEYLLYTQSNTVFDEQNLSRMLKENLKHIKPRIVLSYKTMIVKCEEIKDETNYWSNIRRGPVFNMEESATIRYYKFRPVGDLLIMPSFYLYGSNYKIGWGIRYLL